MEKLHGGVFRVPNSCVIPVTILFGAALCSIAYPSECSADKSLIRSGALSSQDIASIAFELLDRSPTNRAKAFQQLVSLRQDSLPSIRQRINELKKNRPPLERVRQVLHAIRHEVGSRRADDPIDIAPGVLKFLANQRSKNDIGIIEPLLLLRSLEKIGTRQAGIEIVELFSFDQGAWGHELRRVRSRMGVRLLPVLIEMRGNESLAIRRWARRGIRALRMRDPTIAVTLTDHHLVAQIIRAYANPLDYKALPVIVSALSSDRIEVREAARWSIDRFKANAIWQLRIAYEEETGKQAPKRWGYKKITNELYMIYHRELFQKVESAMKQGLTAFHSGSLKQARKYFDNILAIYPNYHRRSEMAACYAALGKHYLIEDDLPEAERLFHSAIRLSPTAQANQKWRAQLAFIRAERQLSRGIADLDGYQKAVHFDPDHHSALMAIDRLSGAWGMRFSTSRRWSRIIAIVLLSLFAFGLLYRQKNSTVPSN